MREVILFGGSSKEDGFPQILFFSLTFYYPLFIYSELNKYFLGTQVLCWTLEIHNELRPGPSGKMIRPVWWGDQ